MHHLLKDYPSVPWEPGWHVCSAPADTTRFVAAHTRGHITVPGERWVLELADPTLPGSIRMLHNGLSIHGRKHSQHIAVFSVGDGVLTGTVSELPPPILDRQTPNANGQTWIKTPKGCTLLLCQQTRFALVTACSAEEPAMAKAEEALALDWDALVHSATKQREPVADLFSINARHNPPVALAAETLWQRLRGPVASLHGIWSTSDGFEFETFSLNDLYPLTRAWMLIDPEIAINLVQTALGLQQSNGGFPAHVNDQGQSAPSAPWPMLAQSFEAVWERNSDSTLLRKHLPTLRKYIQWALRHFDPYRDRIPAWQTEQEVFVPNSFERNKATPELTVMLLGELDAMLRLCQHNEHAQGVIEQLEQDREQLFHNLHTVFWDPEAKTFSNVWKNGHTIHEPSFASFTPLLLPDLPDLFKTSLLERFESTHGLPGQAQAQSWKKEPMDDTDHLPAIHQFITFEALRCSDKNKALLSLFVRRTREGMAAWFERERIETARFEEHTDRLSRHNFSLGPLTACLFLCAQNEFRRAASNTAPTRQTIRRWIGRLCISISDIRIVLFTLLAMMLAHLLYNLGTPANTEVQMAEAALNYKQGKFVAALEICKRNLDHPLSRFLRANLLMLTDNPVEAEKLYLQVLRVKTESPSALFAYSLALQMNGKLDLAIRRYNDFIDIHEAALSDPYRTDLIDLAYEFARLAEEEFKRPPKWRRVFAYPEMNDLGL